MQKRRLAIDIYMSRMFKIIMYFIPFLALSAGICFIVLKAIGNYDSVPYYLLFIFLGTNLIYCIIGAYFATHCEDKEKNLKPKYVTAGKVIISLVIIIQWNFISYMIPSRDFWAFFSLFIIVSIFFLDSKYVVHTSATVLLSIIVSWIINGDNLLPVRDKYFVPEIILRCILIVLIITLMYLITLIVEKLLVKELENIAEYDSLTLLRNRRTLGMMMDDAINSFNKTEKPFCFVMCDIDDFKVVNDTYGHPFGDIVLKNIAQYFILSLGKEAHIFRYGGEEICCILHTDIQSGIERMENVRKGIEAMLHEQGNIKVKVTMSMGITEYHKGLKKEEIIKVSDANLYYAKSHGKNKVVS